MVEVLKVVNLNDWAQIAQIVSGFATFLALLFAAYEYYLHKKNNQYEAYSKLNERYCNDRSIQKVMVTMIESYDNNTFGIDSFNDNFKSFFIFLKIWSKSTFISNSCIVAFSF